MLKIGDPFIELSTVESTNIYAMQQAHARLATPGTVYFAWEQTAGKGQREKTWKSEPGKNLILSAVASPKVVLPDHHFFLSCATALACQEFFNKFSGDETTIKWPNDIYWRDRKAGGILIENIIKGSVWEYAIIGIGLNINQVIFDPALKNPVSLTQITGKKFNILEMAQQLCEILSERYLEFELGHFVNLLKRYNEKLFKRNEMIYLRKNNEILECRLKKVNHSGQLIIESETGEMLINFGEVEWLIPNVHDRG